MIIPAGHRLLVKPFKQEDVDDILKKAKESGFLKDFEIVNSNKKREDASVDRGTVLAVGPDCWPDSKEPWCSVGDQIFFAKFAPKFVEDTDGETYGILNDEDVCAVLKDV